MGFNYTMEKRKFDAKWDLLHKMYRKAGMSKTDIDEMYEYDWNTFLSERRYRMHTQALPADSISEDDGDGMSTLFRKFDSLTVTFSESDFSGRFSWVETVADTELYARLKTLSYADLELLTLFVIDGYLQTEIAEQLHTKRQNINNKIARIKKYLK